MSALVVGDLGGSKRRHGTDEFTQHARNLARIDSVIATSKNQSAIARTSAIDGCVAARFDTARESSTVCANGPANAGSLP